MRIVFVVAFMVIFQVLTFGQVEPDPEPEPEPEIPMPMPAPDPLGQRDTVPFPYGTNLEWCVRMSMSKNGTSPYLSPINDGEVAKITRIECVSPVHNGTDNYDNPNIQPPMSNSIRSFEGIEYFQNLETLIIYGETQIEDLYQLSALPKLKKLVLPQSNVSDLTPLSYLTTLTHLEMPDNQITDLEPLRELVNLSTLVLPRQQPDYITDITPLEDLKKLKILDLQGNKITDISALEGIQLKALDLHDNRITSLEPLAETTSLQAVNLNVNMIPDLTPLTASKSLTTLSAGNNSILSLEFVPELPNLTFLQLSSNYITDLTPLGELNPPRRHMLTFHLDRNSITDVEPLQDIIYRYAVHKLILSYNCIEDAENIRYLREEFIPNLFIGKQCEEVPPYDGNLDDLVNKDLVGGEESENPVRTGAQQSTAGGCSVGQGDWRSDFILFLAGLMAALAMGRFRRHSKK